MMLLKTTKVLDWEDRVGGLEYFVQRDEETNRITLEVAMPTDLYEDFDKPATITVAIEQGDTLNSGD